MYVPEYEVKMEKDTNNKKEKQPKNYVFLISVVLNIALLIVCIDTVRFRLTSVSEEDKLWETSVNNVLYCAQSFEKKQEDETYYYIVSETGTLVNLLQYAGFGDNEQKKQYENLYRQLASNAEQMKTKSSELVEIYTLLSEKDEKVFEKIEEVCNGNSDDTQTQKANTDTDSE